MLLQNAFALADDHDLVLGAVHHRTGHMLPGTTVDDDVNQVLVLLINLFWKMRENKDEINMRVNISMEGLPWWSAG